MFIVAKFIFFASVICIFYTYLGYFIYLFVLYKFGKGQKVRKKEIFPTISVVIAVHNEERNIKAKIENLLTQNYPRELYEIIVVSDGSTDKTNEILRNLEKIYSNLKSIIYKYKKTKPYALNLGVREAKGDIIVFADARQKFASDAFKNLVQNFADETVGCVSGELIFLEDSESEVKAEMGAYWKFEKKIRLLESLTGSVVGATGAIYAIRRSLFVPFPEDILLDDVYLPLKIAERKYRVLFEPKAQAFDVFSPNFAKEKRRKIRTLLGNWQLVFKEPNLILPNKHPLWFRFVSHKFLRLLVPHFIFVAIISSLMINYYWFAMLCLLSIVLYFLPSNIPGLGRILSLNRSFVFLNYCALLAFFFIFKREWNIW